MNYTTKLGLKQFEPTDKPCWLDHYNDDMERIENAYVELISNIYPVGSIFESVKNVSPGSIFGVWREFGPGRVLIGAGDLKDDPSGEKTYAAWVEQQSLSNCGRKEVTLETSQMPSHSHRIKNNAHGEPVGAGIDGFTNAWSDQTYWYPAGWKHIESTGGGQPHDNMPPYIVVYRWRRIS